MPRDRVTTHIISCFVVVAVVILVVGVGNVDIVVAVVIIVGSRNQTLMNGQNQVGGHYSVSKDSVLCANV